MKSKKIIIFLGIIGALLVACVILLFIVLGNGDASVNPDNPSSENVGITNPDTITDIRVDPVTEQDEINEYNELPEYTDSAVSQIDAAISRYLSYGDYEQLESYLDDMNSRYSNQNNEEDQDVVNQTQRIEFYRSDIALIDNINEHNGEVMFQSFSTPDTCASAVIYTNISQKLYAFLNLDSKVYNAPFEDEAEDVNLTEAEMSASECAEKLQEINAKNDEYDYINLAAYDCTLHNIDYRILVLQSSFGKWRPYSIMSVNGGDENVSTVFELQKMKNQNPNIDLDSIDFDILSEGGAGAPGMIDRDEEEGPGPVVNPEDPGTTEPPENPDVPETPDAPTVPGQPVEPPTEQKPEVSWSADDQQALNDLQKILDSYDVNTTSLTVIQNTINQVQEIANRSSISPEMKTLIQEKVDELQQSYDKLEEILNS